MSLAKEGYPFVYVPAAVSLLALALGWWLAAAILAGFALFFGWFFRDPERVVPEGPGLIVAPADGTVVSVVDVSRVPQLEGANSRISIFMSPFDVHINRIPFEGRVENVAHRPGRFLAAYKDHAVEQNEQNALRIVTPDGARMAVVQVAGWLARRIVCRAKVGDLFARGERFGLIMFGSRTDLYLPHNVEIKVAERQRVKGGETVVARFA